ncbi:MAG: hypothetical protein ACP5UB_02135 [Candidatus Sumerlaeaceae bacterium]
MKRVVAAAVGLALFGCQSQQNTESGGTPKEQKAKAPVVQKTSQSKPATKTTAASPTPKQKKLGPKATAESYELSDACKIVSGSVLRIMHFAAVKGELKADKPPKAIKFVLEGDNKDGYYPHAKVATYDPAGRKWQTLDSVVVKGQVAKKYLLSNVPAGTVSFVVHYDAVDPAGGNVRPSLFVKAVELEF